MAYIDLAPTLLKVDGFPRIQHHLDRICIQSLAPSYNLQNAYYILIILYF